MALLRIAALYERYWPGWARFIIGVGAAFHATLAAVLALFPYRQLLTEGTAPQFDLASRYAWAAGFAAVAVGIALSLRVHKPWLHALAWVAATFLFGAWLTPLVLAVVNGGGSPVAVVVLLWLYGLIFAGAITNALRSR